MSTDDERRGPQPGEKRSHEAEPTKAESTPAEPIQPEPIELPENPPEPAPYAEQPEQPGKDTGQATPRVGRIRHQDPETAVPREPSLAERRARERAERRRQQEERARQAEEDRKRKTRKRVLIGGGVTVGVVALIAAGYAAAQPDEIEARCVDENNIVVDEDNCANPAPGTTASGGYYHGGFVPFPVFIGSGGRQYHYNYGGTGAPGQVATGGTTVAPKNATVKTPSGKTIQRGGFGVSGSGGKSGGS